MVIRPVWGLLGAVLLGTLGLALASTYSEGDGVAHLTSSNYEETISSGKVVFTKYYAPWCGHCKQLAPTWIKLAADVKDNESIVIAHVDCTSERDICNAAEIKGYPTLKVMHKGEEVATHRGSRDLFALKSFIEKTARELTSEL